MPDDEVVALLEHLYELLPKIECLGLCWNSCGPIDMSNAERERIRERGIEIHMFTADRAERWADDEDLHCNALGPLHQCKVYDIRPLICRLWGVAASMPCTHGCTPEGGWLDDESAMTLIMEANRIGGHRFNGTEDVMMRVLADPLVKPLYARFARGDRTVLRELGAAMADTKVRLGL